MCGGQVIATCQDLLTPHSANVMLVARSFAESESDMKKEKWFQTLYSVNGEATPDVQAAATRGDCRGWFHNRDTIAIVRQQSRYCHDSGTTIAIPSIHFIGFAVGSVEWLCLLLMVSKFVVLPLYFNVTWHTLHATRFLSITSPSFNFYNKIL